ncbi:RND transporter [marine bacterium AO1-C]|nr:RND transporter [marine bacterium AO1-C]
MRSIVAYFIKYPITGNLLMVLILLFGWFGLQSIRSTFFPETESKNISIQVVYPGSSPQEIEEGIVAKIEDNLKGVTGIDRISSVSRENAGTVTVEVESSYDTDKVLQDVKNSVDRISSFPSGMEPPVVYKRENLSFAISFALSGNVSLKNLKKFARACENDLLAVDGISKVTLSGFPDEEIEISFRETDLRAYKITFDQASAAVRKANLEITGGKVKGAKEEFLIRARSKRYYAKDLENIVLKSTPDGKIVRLSDVATISDQWAADNPSRSYLNKKPSVVVTVQNTINEDIFDITEKVQAYIKEYNENNKVVKATVIRDGSDYLRQRINLLVNNGMVGAILVVIFLALFLHYRLAFWVAISIPICFMGMFILGSFFGMSINVISLFGMILVIGILVDDGIVIAESIYQEYEKGKNPTEAAIEGTMKVLPAVFSAILTTVVAFSLFYFIEGRIGDIFSNMAFVVICTLIFSLVEGALILPAHVSHSKALKSKEPTKVEQLTSRLMNWLRSTLYAPILRFSLKNKFFTIAVFIAMFLVTMGAFQGGIIRTTFFPFVERDNLTVSVTMPAGTRETITEKWIKHIEQAVYEVNKDLEKKYGQKMITKVERNIGPSTYEANLQLALIGGEKRPLASFAISNAIRQKAGPIPLAEKVAYNISSPFGRAISVSLLGFDKNELDAAKEELKAEMSKMKVLKDVVDSDQQGLREINIELKDKARQLGFQVQDILNQVRQGFFGSEAQRLQRGIDEVKVWVRYEEKDRSTFTNLENMRIRTVTGQEFYLKDLATFSVKRGVIAINHLDNKREIKVEADLANPNSSATEVIRKVRADILPSILAKYKSVQVSYEGQSRSSAKTGQSIGKAGPPILVLMIALIMLTFRSVSQTLAVVLLIPFGFVGVAWGHVIHGMAISILSMLGIIALIGVLVNDALVFVSALNSNLKEGKKYDDAVYEAGLSRFRPILLTSLTTIAGLGPLIAEKSMQAQFLIPMAVSLAYGLAMATAIMLILLPVLLVVFNRFNVMVLWLWQGEKPSTEVVEPAVREALHEGILTDGVPLNGNGSYGHPDQPPLSDKEPS